MKNPWTTTLSACDNIMTPERGELQKRLPQSMEKGASFKAPRSKNKVSKKERRFEDDPIEDRR